MNRTRPTIGHVLHSLTVGGAEMLATRLARRLRDRYRFVFICLDGSGPLADQLRAEGIAVHMLDRRPGLDGGCIFRLRRLFAQERIELIHAHQYAPFFYGMAARFLGRSPPVLFTEHGRDFPDYRRRKRMLATRLLLRRCDRIVAVGEAVRQALIRNEGIPAHRAEVLYNGIDPACYCPVLSTRDAVRRELGIGVDDPMILQVARLDPLKDHATALAALAQIIRARPNVRLVLTGDGPLRADLQRRVRERGLAAHVRFLGTRRDVPRLLQAADLLLLTSISEGIPLTLLEGMAAELPVVATRVGGVAEVVLAGITGLLAEAGDSAALGKKVLDLISFPSRRRQMGQLGRRRVEELFSESRMADQYEAAYGTMLGKRTVERLAGAPTAVPVRVPAGD